MCFIYCGYTVSRLGLRLFLVIGPDFRGFETSVSTAIKTIDGIISGRCEE